MKQKGFTLIELLVVIAIIGILSAIVLASLSSSRNKSKDARIAGEMASLRASAELYAVDNNGYSTLTEETQATTGTFLENSKVLTDLQTIAGSENVSWKVSSAGYKIIAKLTDNNYWCIDNTGASRKSASESLSTDTCDGTIIGGGGGNPGTGAETMEVGTDQWFNAKISELRTKASAPYWVGGSGESPGDHEFFKYGIGIETGDQSNSFIHSGTGTSIFNELLVASENNAAWGVNGVSYAIAVKNPSTGMIWCIDTSGLKTTTKTLGVCGYLDGSGNPGDYYTISSDLNDTWNPEGGYYYTCR